jgi:hypothetical protein
VPVVIVHHGYREFGKEISYRTVCPTAMTNIDSVNPPNRDRNFFHGFSFRKYSPPPAARKRNTVAR